MFKRFEDVIDAIQRLSTYCDDNHQLDEKLTVLVDGYNQEIGSFVSPLFSDYTKEDLNAMHCYRMLNGLKLVVDDHVVSSIPYSIIIIDGDGSPVVTLYRGEDGWDITQFPSDIFRMKAVFDALTRIYDIATAA